MLQINQLEAIWIPDTKENQPILNCLPLNF